MARKAKIIIRPPKTWDDVPPVVDSEYVAILFGLSVKSIQALTRAGEIPATRLGKKYRYDKGQLMKLMSAEEVAQP